MTSADWGLFFAGISAFCAIIGVPASYKSWQNKKDTELIKNSTELIKDEIEEYHQKILEKHDLLRLVPKLNLIKNISGEYMQFIDKATSIQIDREDELIYYNKIKGQIGSILNEIPEKYSEIRSILSEIKNEFGHCIINQKTFNELERNSPYGYYDVEHKLDSVIAKIDTLAREIQY